MALPLEDDLMGTTPFADVAQRPAIASSQCPHSDLDIRINHQAFDDSNMHYLEMRATCKICGKPMVFRGMPLGVSPEFPTMELGGEEVRLPVLAEGEEPKGKILGFVGQRVV